MIASYSSSVASVIEPKCGIDAGIAHQNVDRAVRGFRLAHQPVEVRVAADVADHADRLHPFGDARPCVAASQPSASLVEITTRAPASPICRGIASRCRGATR